MPAEIIRPRLARLIKHAYPSWADTDHICLADLNRYRMAYVRQVLEAELGELSVLETDVLDSLKEHELVANDVEEEFQMQRPVGERLSDMLATVGTLFLWTIVERTVVLRSPESYNRSP